MLLPSFATTMGKRKAKYLNAPTRRVHNSAVFTCSVLRPDLQRNVLEMITKKDAEYALHVAAMKKSRFKIIGYCRKSIQPPCDDDKRLKLLEIMMEKLKQRSKVQKVYVSWSSDASSSITSRDVDQDQAIGDGSTQDMVTFLRKTRQRVIIVIRDFAGLSTDPQGVRAFLNEHPSISHVYVDRSPFSADVLMLPTAQILKNDETANLFDCRRPCRPRSY